MAQVRAQDIMTRDVKTVRADAPLREAAELFTTHGISGAPVVDETGNVVGMVSESDLINPEKRRAALPRMAVFGVYVVPEETLQRAYQEGMSLPTREVMSRNVLSAAEDTPADELARRMVASRINRVPILRDNKPVGIVTREDILRGLMTSPGAAPVAEDRRASA
jgi:CBS domain-containing protein